MQIYKRGLALLLAIVILLPAAGCRLRVFYVQEAEAAYEPELQESIDEPPADEISHEPEPYENLDEEEIVEESDYTSAETTEEQFEIVIATAAYEAIEIPYETEAYGIAYGGEEDIPVPIEPEELECASADIVTIEEYTSAPGETTLENDGDGTIGLIIDRYTDILNQGVGSLFECQRVYVYFERPINFQTVNRSFAEHNLILEAGGYNVAYRRGNDALVVDTDWVLRRNPAVIVKAVAPDILGSGVTDSSRAEAVLNEIISRPGWESLNAVIGRNIIIISEELMLTYEGRLLAKLHIAKAMYPTLFLGVDMAGLYYQIKTAGGAVYSGGVYAHPMP